MSRLQVIHDSAMTSAIKQLYEDSARRSKAAPAGNCPVGQCAAYAWQCLSQTCGKCVPCRVGLTRVAQLLDASGATVFENLKLKTSRRQEALEQQRSVH